VRAPDRPLLPGPLRTGAVVLAIVAALVVAVLAVRYRGASEPGRVDGHLDNAIDALPGTGHDIAGAVTFFGSPKAVALGAVVLALVCLAARRPRWAVLAVAGPALTGVATTLGKPLVGRTIDDSLAFPSGHTGGSTSLALVTALIVAAALGLGTAATAALAAVCAVLGGGAVGTAMALIGAHYPTDVVGGFGTAVAVVLLVALALDARSRRRTAVRTG
jgi:membrane-associated phospholipid phosphatase